MRGCVWLVVVLLVVLCVWLCVELKESNAHAHRCNAKKQTISHTYKNKKSTPPPCTCKGYAVLIQSKSPLIPIFSGFLCVHTLDIRGKLCLCVYHIPPQNFLLNICHSFCHSFGTIRRLFSPSTI